MYTIGVASRYRLLITVLYHSDPRLRIHYLLSNLLPIIPNITPLYLLHLPPLLTTIYNCIFPLGNIPSACLRGNNSREVEHEQPVK